eukprot:753790-Hanusia_phi.AAC.6
MRGSGGGQSGDAGQNGWEVGAPWEGRKEQAKAESCMSELRSPGLFSHSMASESSTTCSRLTPPSSLRPPAT